MMQTRSFFAQTLAIAALALSVLSPNHAWAQNYTTVNPVQPSDTAGRIEVLEFFAYTCPHCKAMEPLATRWAATLPENVVLKPVPVAFNTSMADLQRLYYSLEALDRLDLHRAVFRAIHDQRKRIFDAKAISDWIAEQGVDRERFEATFKSFGVQTKVARANELARLYRIEGTPTLAVGGRFTTSPSQNASYEATITQAQLLLTRVLNGGERQTTNKHQSRHDPIAPATQIRARA